MPILDHHDVRIHYEVHGTGHPVLLLHGGTVSFRTNYSAFGWVDDLSAQGLQVIGLDFRGHGKSDKPRDVQSYGTAKLAEDVIAVMDELELRRVSLVGYSLGTAIALHLLQYSPERFDKCALIATGDGLVGHPPYRFDLTLPALTRVLQRTEYPKDLPQHLSAYWNFVAATSGDWQALQAFSQASYPPISRVDAASITIPTLVVSGQHDVVLGQGVRLAQILGRSQYLEVAGADHFSLATDPRVKAAVVQFLHTARVQ